MLSPGPCTPNEAGICLDLIEQAAPTHSDPRRLPRPSGDRPGVRRQGGARARRRCTASCPRCAISGAGVFRGINGPFKATRYHSLVVDRDTMPDELERHRGDRRRPGDGAVAQDAAGARRAVPSGKHRLRARPPDPEEFSRSRRAVECRARRAAVRRDADALIEEVVVSDDLKALIAKVATGAVADARGSRQRLRPHDVGRSHALADGRPADGAARARRDRRRDHRRGCRRCAPR